MTATIGQDLQVVCPLPSHTSVDYMVWWYRPDGWKVDEERMKVGEGDGVLFIRCLLADLKKNNNSFHIIE